MARGVVAEKASRDSKTERLVARATREQKARILRAADMSGRSLTDFLLDNALAAADETIRTHQVLELTIRETETFFAALENPPEFDEKMQEAARWHRENVEVRW